MGFVAMTERSDAWRKVRAILYMRGWTQQNLADMTGYSAIYVRDVLMGLRRSPKVQEKVASVLGFSCWAELEAADVGVRT
jgi:transcriptional regulator with XRE-family HTH domain